MSKFGDFVNKWLGREGGEVKQENAWPTSLEAVAEANVRAGDPRLHDSMQNEAQFDPAELDKAERESPELAEDNAASVEQGFDMDDWGPEIADVETISVGAWQFQGDGEWETRLYIGKSEDGYHHATETSRLGGDDGELVWSAEAYDTAEDARNAAAETMEPNIEQWEQEAEEREERSIAGLEQATERSQTRGAGMER